MFMAKKIHTKLELLLFFGTKPLQYNYRPNFVLTQREGANISGRKMIQTPVAPSGPGFRTITTWHPANFDSLLLRSIYSGQRFESNNVRQSTVPPIAVSHPSFPRAMKRRLKIHPVASGRTPNPPACCVGVCGRVWVCVSPPPKINSR